MKRVLFAAILTLTPVLALAQEQKPVVLTLTQEEAQALAGLMDAGVRASGLRAVADAAVLVKKLDAALQAAQQPPLDKPKETK
jgi:hypothetical protein